MRRAAATPHLSPAKLSTNIHEAGHGVMTILAGFLTQYITNIPNKTSAGRMYWAPGQRTPFAIVRDIATSDAHGRALIYVAGVAAVREITGDHATLRGADETCARTFARTIGDDEDAVVEALCTEAQRVFMNEHVRNATVCVASRLERDRVVSGAEIERRILDVGLTRIEPLQFRTASRESHQRGTVLGNGAFVDAASPQYFFTKRRST
jgi:hypothetical protein